MTDGARVQCPYCEAGYVTAYRFKIHDRVRRGHSIRRVKCRSCKGVGTLTKEELEASQRRIEWMNTPAKSASENQETEAQP